MINTAQANNTRVTCKLVEYIILHILQLHVCNRQECIDRIQYIMYMFMFMFMHDSSISIINEFEIGRFSRGETIPMTSPMLTEGQMKHQIYTNSTNSSSTVIQLLFKNDSIL